MTPHQTHLYTPTCATNMEGVPHTHTYTQIFFHLCSHIRCSITAPAVPSDSHVLSGSTDFCKVHFHYTASDKQQQNDTAREVLSSSMGYACVWVSHVLFRWCSYFKMGVASWFLSPLAKYTHILLLKEWRAGVRWEGRFPVVPLIVLEQMKKFFYCTHEKMWSPVSLWTWRTYEVLGSSMLSRNWL